jgi:hypothetical protein
MRGRMHGHICEARMIANWRNLSSVKYGKKVGLTLLTRSSILYFVFYVCTLVLFLKI